MREEFSSKSQNGLSLSQHSLRLQPNVVLFKAVALHLTMSFVIVNTTTLGLRNLDSAIRLVELIVIDDSI